MATKKHKRRKRDTRSAEQKEQSARDLAAQAEAKASKKGANAKSTKAQAKSAKQVAKSDDKNAKPSLITRFVNYCKAVKGEMQRVVWPTRPELVNASVIVISALIFFGVGIAIIDNIIILPLDAISTLGVKFDG